MSVKPSSVLARPSSSSSRVAASHALSLLLCTTLCLADLILLLAGMLNVLCTRLLVLSAEVFRAIPCEPRAELADLFFEAGDGLSVHVGLGDELRHVDCKDH